MNIDEADVIAATDRLKNNFTSGPDGLPPVFFRHLKHAIAKPLAIIFRQLLSVAYILKNGKKPKLLLSSKMALQTSVLTTGLFLSPVCVVNILLLLF